MSSNGGYAEIGSSRTMSSHGKVLRKMSCFDTRERPKLTKHTYSTNSLPRYCSRNGRESSEGPAGASPFFEVHRIPAEDIAAQLTLIDSELFCKIDLDELTNCGWIKKNKRESAPNVLNYTRRFNHVSYWVIEEILGEETPKGRANILSYFIRVCKRLQDLNNLHSLFAIVSALRSASIYRLNQTWSLVSKKEKATVDKLAEIFSDKDNWSKLRSILDSLKLPCVPYIGVYLTDLVYVSMANPGGNLKDSAPANNIFRIMTTYQADSNYCHLPRDYPLQAQLRSIRYIDELLKFVEDDNFKKSCDLEPSSAPALSTLMSSPQGAQTSPRKNSQLPPKVPPPPLIKGKSGRNLLDDSTVSEKGCDVDHESSTTTTNGGPLTVVPIPCGDVAISGHLRRKTLLKNGKKPPIAAWQRFWVQLWGPVLLFFAPKSLTGTERSDFKSEPSKMKSVDGWLIQMGEDPVHPDSFHIAHPATGTMYKLRAGSASQALTWCRKLQEAQASQKKSRSGHHNHQITHNGHSHSNLIHWE